MHKFTHLLIAEKGDDLTLDEWKAVTRVQFLVYCANPRSPPTHITSPAHGELKEWNKSIKREISAYPHLKDITAFDIWKMKFESVIISHGVDKVIDSTYRATTQQEKDIFRKHQDFVFAVLLTVVTYDKGKSIVRTHAHARDAQKAYAAICSDAKSSTSAKITKRNLVTFLTTKRLDSTWRGTSNGFVLHWMSQLRRYTEIAPTTEHYTDAQKKAMLSAAVSGVAYLHRVETDDEALTTSGSTPYDFDKYLHLVENAATRHDEQLKASGRSRHRISQHHIDYDATAPDDYVDGGDQFFDDAWEHTPDGNDFFDDSYDNTLALYESKQRPSTPSKQRPYLDKKIWDQLDLKSQLIIRGVAPEERERILAVEKVKNMKPAPRSAHNVRFADAEPPDHPNSNLNFEEELKLLISKHSIQDRVNRDPNQASSPSSNHEPQPLIDRIANRHQQLPPHDIRRVMSTSHQRQPDTQEPPSNEDIESRLPYALVQRW